MSSQEIRKILNIVEQGAPQLYYFTNDVNVYQNDAQKTMGREEANRHIDWLLTLLKENGVEFSSFYHLLDSVLSTEGFDYETAPPVEANVASVIHNRLYTSSITAKKINDNVIVWAGDISDLF